MRCKHTNTEIINNGGEYCKDCLETNLQHKVIKDNKGNILFKGNIWECEKYLDSLLPEEPVILKFFKRFQNF